MIEKALDGIGDGEVFVTWFEVVPEEETETEIADFEPKRMWGIQNRICGRSLQQVRMEASLQPTRQVR